jgi:alpha-L-rhamnosidase
MLQKTYPSLLNLIGTGATTMTENWEGQVEYDDIRTYDSMNHFAFGVPGRWIFEYLGGIRILEAGFRSVLLAPTPYKEIGRLRATHKSPEGVIETEISYNAIDDTFTYSYVIPVGIKAFIRLPGMEQAPITKERGSFTFKA